MNKAGAVKRSTLLFCLALGGLLYLLMYFAGDPLGVLRALGLPFRANLGSGIHTDCSRPENRNHRYCQRPGSGNQVEYNNLRKDRRGSGFSLTGP